MITRRGFLRGAVGAGLGLVALSTYALGIEPAYRLVIKDYTLTPQNWPKGLDLTIAMIADIHAGGYNMPLSRVDDIIAQTNALKPDLIVFLGDCLAGYRKFGYKNPVTFQDVAKRIAQLKAPLGVFSVMGNHDWWDDWGAQERLAGPTLAHKAFEEVGLRVLENDALRLTHKGKSFWLAGLGDQLAFPIYRARQAGISRGVDNLPKTLAKIPNNAPIVLLAHEPNIFTKMPERVNVTLSGHTHGGQVNLFGFKPIKYLVRKMVFPYGHFQDGAKNLIVSGGLGCSHVPVRLGVPPEITRLRLIG